MPKPSTYHIDAALTNFAVELGVGGPFVADQVYPVVPVKKESDKYWVYESPELRDDINPERMAGSEAQEIDWNASTATYSCHEKALRRFLSNRTLNNADNPEKVRMQTVKKLMHKIRLNIEKEIAAVLLSTSYMTNYTTPSVKWDAASGTIDIEGDIDTAKEAVVTQCGFEPNVIIIPPAVVNAVKSDSTIKDLRKYTDPTLLINGGLPPQLFGLRVIVPGAINNTANPAQTDSISRIWSTDGVLVAFVDYESDTENYSLGKQFRCRMDAEGVEDLAAVWTYEVPGRHGMMYEVGILQDHKLVSAAAGHLLNDVLT